MLDLAHAGNSLNATLGRNKENLSAILYCAHLFNNILLREQEIHLYLSDMSMV